MGSRAKLSIGTAIQDGWHAFRLAPWAFVGFVLLSSLLAQLANVIPLFGALVATLVNLWGGVGLIRSSWIALEGTAPSFEDFTRWNSSAVWRLFSRQLVLTLLLLPIALVVIVVALSAADAWTVVQPLMNLALTVDPNDPQLADAGRATALELALNFSRSPLAWLTVAIGLLFATYFQVNQSFLGFLALLDDLNPIATIQRGITVVQSQWWQVLSLLILQVLILLLGFLACVVGLVAAAPVCICITGAAYRQLFGQEDKTGLISTP